MIGCLRPDGDAVLLRVRLTPKADCDAADGVTALADGTVVAKVRVRAIPEDGAANAALVRLIAKSIGVPKSAIAVVSGATQRVKQVRIAGSADDLVRRLEEWLVD